MRIRHRTMNSGLLAGLGVAIVRREAEVSASLHHLSVVLRGPRADVTEALARAIGLGADAESILAATHDEGRETLRRAVDRATAPPN